MIVVVGMAFEARIASSLGVRVICGGDGKTLAGGGVRASAMPEGADEEDARAGRHHDG